VLRAPLGCVIAVTAVASGNRERRRTAAGALRLLLQAMSHESQSHESHLLHPAATADHAA
jgi:hypothetical protein